VGGKLVRRAVNLGDAVKPGQLLAQLDPQDLKLGQDAARAALTAAQVNFEQAEADFKRFKELRDQGFISGADLERRDTTVKSARAQLEQARAQSNVQGNQAAYASLVADVAGVVTAVEAEPGAVVAAGTPVVRVAVDGPRDVVFSVPEDRVGAIKSIASKPGNLTVRGWGGDTAAALPVTLREIAASADPVTRTFLVKADLGTSPEARAMRLGQTATVIAASEKVDGIVKLPLAALREDHGKSAVWIVDPSAMTIKSQPVEVAGADGNEAVVTGGLSPGMVVVTAGVHLLNSGQKVKYYAEPGASAVASNPTPVTAK
jgi:membrane fusion protein, multidrug efflux system